MAVDSNQDGRLYLRISGEDKARLLAVIEELNRLRPEAGYTLSTVARAAVLKKIDSLEKEIAKLRKTR